MKFETSLGNTNWELGDARWTHLDCIAKWRLDASSLNRMGIASEIADEKRRCADEIEAAARRTDCALVSLSDAARISGFSPRQRSRLVCQKRIPNHGSKTRPKVAVGDLPRKAGMARQ